MLGYIMFILLATFGGGFAAILGTPVFLIVTAPVMAIVRHNAEASKAVGAVGAGMLQVVVLFTFAALTLWISPETSTGWLVGIGTLLILIASPKIMNARYAVPASIGSFFLLSLML